MRQVSQSKSDQIIKQSQVTEKIGNNRADKNNHMVKSLTDSCIKLKADKEFK